MTSFKSLYKLRIRASEKLKTVWELHNFETHQKAKLDYHRLKTMVKKSIEHELGSRNFEARNGRIESNILVKNQRGRRRVHKGQGECWQWRSNGQCTKGDHCSFRHDRNKRAKATTQPTPSPEHTTQAQGIIQRYRKVQGVKVRLGKYLVNRAKNIFKVLVRIHLVKSGTPWSACFSRQKRDAHSGISARAAQQKVKKNCEKKWSCFGDRDKEFGLCIPGHGAAEVFIDFTEQLNHAET